MLYIPQWYESVGAIVGKGDECFPHASDIALRAIGRGLSMTAGDI
jgi:hypothetical protein